MEMMYPIIRIKMGHFRCCGFFALALIFASFSRVSVPLSLNHDFQDALNSYIVTG